MHIGINDNELAPVLFVPHGGGPLPLLGDPAHKEMVEFLAATSLAVGKPDAIVVISAHWESEKVSVTSGAKPALIYDYSGFPEESYHITYPAPGQPELAQRIAELLHQHNIPVQLDAQRGFDHGMFVPLKLMYPEATIPCVQLSLLHSLDPEAHVNIGRALSSLRRENLLIVGSGFSFHNLQALLRPASGEQDLKNQEFESWLAETCTAAKMTEPERMQRLIQWSSAPHARYCHPREEHLLPLHVCYGVCTTPARQVFNGEILGKRVSGYLW